MIYLGTSGRLIGIKCPSVQRDTVEERYRFTITLEGKRKAQVIPGGPRSWDITLGDLTTPGQVAVLRDFASGAWGDGPFWFVPAEGPDTNVLPPEVVSCTPEGVLASSNGPGGPMRTIDGVAPCSIARVDPPGLIHFGGSSLGGVAPVIPGRAVTAAAYVEGDSAAVQVAWRDADGSFISASTSSVTATASTVVRSHVTVTPPTEAVWASVRAVNSVRGARPSLSWTDQLVPFSDGRGARQVVVDQVSAGLVHTRPGRTYQNLSFVVTEVG